MKQEEERRKGEEPVEPEEPENKTNKADKKDQNDMEEGNREKEMQTMGGGDGRDKQGNGHIDN